MSLFKRELTPEEYAAIFAQHEGEGGGDEGESWRKIVSALRELYGIFVGQLPELQPWEADAIWERLLAEINTGATQEER